MKKILLVTRPIVPPWDEASKNFAFELAKNSPDFEFGLLTNGILPNLPSNILQKPIYTSNNFSCFQKLRLLFNLKKIEKEFDILHFIFTPTKRNVSFLGKLAKNKKTIQTIATLREDLYSDAEIKNLLFADKIVTYSKYSETKLLDLGLNNVHHIYPGINLENYRPTPKSDKLISDFGFRISDFIITYPGEYFRLGATDDIVDSILQCSRAWEDKNIKFIFACRVKNKEDETKKQEVIKKLKENNILEKVIFTDTVSDMASIYNLSDIVIFPVRDMKGKFDVPLAVIEAMACTKPVIISDLPILREFANTENSVIIEKSNPKQLADAILDLYDHPEKRMQLGQNARKFVENNFDVKKVAEKYKEIYKTL